MIDDTSCSKTILIKMTVDKELFAKNVLVEGTAETYNMTGHEYCPANDEGDGCHKYRAKVMSYGNKRGTSGHWSFYGQWGKLFTGENGVEHYPINMVR